MGQLSMSHRTHGFTLIETLVALALFAVVFAALSASLAGGIRGVRLARMDLAATMLARAKLAAAGVETPLADAQQETGETDGFMWFVNVRQHLRPDVDVRETGPKAYWVAIDVSWRDGPLSPRRTIQLKTLKLGPG